MATTNGLMARALLHTLIKQAGARRRGQRVLADDTILEKLSRLYRAKKG